MKRNASRATESKVSPDTATENDATEADAAAAAEFDAAADAARDPFFATFTVEAKTVLNSTAAAKFGEAVTFTVTRQRKGSYVASHVAAEEGATPTVGKEGRKAKTAINAVIGAIGEREGNFMFDADADEAAKAPIPEKAGDNQPETFFFDEESEISSRLKTIEANIRSADELLKGAAKHTKEGWIGFGRAYNEAKAIFAEAGLSGEGDDAAVKRGNAAWGMWLRTRFAGSENVERILAAKNAAAQAGFFATAPEAVIDAVGVNTASTFMRKAEEAASEFGAAIASGIMAERHAAEDDDKTLTLAQAFASAQAKRDARVKSYDASFAKWKAEAEKAAEKGKNVQPFSDAKLKGPLTLVGWMLDGSPDAATFDGSKLHKAIVKAWDAETTKPSEAEKAEAETDKAAKTIAKRFADMSVEDAARHLLAMLVAHPTPDSVLDRLGDMLVEHQEAVIAKEAAAKAEGEKEAAE
jgi:hypothetical protein